MSLRFDRRTDPKPPIPVHLAIARGVRLVNRPVQVIILGGMLLALVLLLLSPWFLLLAPLAWLLGWGWWSYAVPQWRRWAIGRGVDPGALQWYGEQATLVWPVGHWGERTEFGSASARRALQPQTPRPQPHPDFVASQRAALPSFSGTPSTHALIRGVILIAVGFAIAHVLLGAIFPAERRPDVLGSLFFGFFVSVMYAASTYRLEAWRKAVAPEHAIGLGLVACLCIVALIALTPNLAAGRRWTLIALGALLALGPLSLIVMGGVEWRRRRRES